MRFLTLGVLFVVRVTQLLSQQPGYHPPETTTEVANLPMQAIGRNDLVGLHVYDAPELSRSFRVGADGTLRLPMLKQRINALGLMPVALESVIAEALVQEHIMMQPIVTVSIVEYQSRPIRVVGAFRAPLTFEANSTVNLLDAISRAGGFADNAGPEILVTHTQMSTSGENSRLTQRISISELMENTNSSLNMELHGGEEIRLPEAGRIYIVGNVKKPGVYPIRDGGESSVLKALSLSEGLDKYAGKTAYIYRKEGGSAGKNEITVDLKSIVDRKSTDVPLLSNDILYITDNSRRRNTMTVLEKMLLIGGGLSGALVYALVK
jgi:polysaccharide export outer membrane protein